MSHLVKTFFVLFLGVSCCIAGTNIPPLQGLKEVDSMEVELRGGFWGPRLKLHHEVTIPHALSSLEEDGHVVNFDKAAGKCDGPLTGHGAFDSDLYKALEGAIYSLQHNKDDLLRQRVEVILDRIIAAQQEDGFLIAYHIVNGLDKRWNDLRLGHQMYNAGHFFEMAVAHNQLTGDQRVLRPAKRFADNLDSTFGPDKRYDVDGHQEVELALVKLFRATGERRYLDLARFFLDERGYAHGMERKPFDPKSQVIPVVPEKELTREQQREFWHARLRIRNGRMQDHKPVIEQLEAVGHAVRAGYMYSAMSDIVRFMQAPGYENALDHIWDDVVSHKMYITGGIGTGQYDDEGFGDPYLLPNESAYCETCAAIAHVLWQHRMNLLKAQSKYADIMELALYNAVLSGISLSGDRFFYENPLACGTNGLSRRNWISLACCPANIVRMIPQVGGLIYALGRQKVYINLYMSGDASIRIDDKISLKLTQQTDYPFDGNVKFTVSPEKTSRFALCLRIPGWATGNPVPSDLYSYADTNLLPVGIKINGRKEKVLPESDGYVHLERRWKVGDVVEMNLPMPVRRVYAHRLLEENNGKVALMRGPLVYCFEAVDNQPQKDFTGLMLLRDRDISAEHCPELLGGITILQCKAFINGHLPFNLRAIPYYAWANREKGAMTVWINEQPLKALSSSK